MRTAFEKLLKSENEDVCVKASSSFFVITSENVCRITKSHIYGYCIVEDRCYKNCDLENEELNIEKGYGSYIYLHKTDTEIEVSGDENGSICIYLYKNDDYWAFSNSFWMLCDEVTKEHQITLDENYAKHYMNVQMASLSARNTLANEIKIVPLYSIISIKEGKLTIRKFSKEIFSHTIDSEESLSIIDKWIKDWMFLIDSLVQSGYPVTFDLTGGFDSRVVFALARAAKIDFERENVRVFSIVPTTLGQRKHNGEDYDIANKICSYYGIALNKKIEGFNLGKLTGKQSFNLAWHSRLAFHKQAQFVNCYHLDPVFYVGGRFGEPVRGKVRDIDTWLSYATSACFGAREFDIASYKEVIDSIGGKEDRDNLLSRHVTLVNFYKKTWSRTHYGLEGFQTSCINQYQINPLSDGRLLQIRPTFENNVGSDLIYAIIIMRICPELLDFPFAHGEQFSDETLALAEKINALKKSCLNTVSVKREIDFSNLGDPQFKMSHDNSAKSGEEILEELFQDEQNKSAFISRFGIIGEKVYEKALSDYRDDSIIFPVQRIVPIVAIMRMLQYEKDSSPYNNYEVLKREQLGMLKKLMEEHPESKRLKRKCKNDIFPQILEEKGIRSIGIYGAGNRGKWLCDELALTDIKIVFATDQNSEALLPGIKMIPIYEPFPQVDAIIVTPEGYFEEIKEMLLHKDGALNLIDLQDYT
ncbi:MAG: hypothetical protein HDR07_10840 [Lachnospiraceae bacterium]|nr:hypothetical protein [Lachnospiraceae bacterium]